MPIMSKLTAAYLAGLIDGEGSLEIRKEIRNSFNDKKDYYRPRIRIALTNQDLINWLKKSFGGWICERRPKNEKWADSYGWVMMGSTIKPILEKVYPYLRIKKKQADILKRFLKTFNKECYTIGNIGNGFTGKNRIVKKEIYKEREKLLQEIRQLNRKGKPLHAERLSENTLLKRSDSPTLLETRD